MNSTTPASRPFKLVVAPGGTVRHLIAEDMESVLSRIGEVVDAYRNSVVDMLSDLSEDSRALAQKQAPDAGPLTWWADLQRLPNGPLLGPFETREEALQAEVAWLNTNHIPLKEQ